MNAITSLQKIILALLSISVIGMLVYNFKIGYEDLYNIGADDTDYVMLGATLSETGKYGWLEISAKEFFDDIQNGVASNKDYAFRRHSTWRPPLWPLFIAGIFLVFGYHLKVLLISKFILMVLGGFLFFRTLRLWKVRFFVAAMGGLLYCILPAAQLYSRLFRSEPFTLFVCTLFLFFLVRSYQKKSSYFLAALSGGLLLLAHPYYLFLPFITFGFLFLFRSINFKTLVLSCSLVLGVLSIWVVRNSIVLDTSEVVITTSSGAVMAKGWNHKVIELHNNITGDLAREELVLRPEDLSNPIYKGEVGSSTRYKDATMRFIKENPRLWIPITLTKLRSAFNPLREAPKPGILETGRVVFHCVALIALLFLLVRSRDPLIKSLVWSLVMATIAITVLTYSGFRFRMPQIVLELFFVIIASMEALNMKNDLKV